MTDLEITRLCAEAMGINCKRYPGGNVPDQFSYWIIADEPGAGSGGHYRPLHDDEQALALVKRFPMKIEPNEVHGGWTIFALSKEIMGHDFWNKNLNRAICECVAKMQQAKAIFTFRDNVFVKLSDYLEAKT